MRRRARVRRPRRPIRARLNDPSFRAHAAPSRFPFDPGLAERTVLTPVRPRAPRLRSRLILNSSGVCYTYDDVIFHPGHIDFAADAVDLSTKLTRNITIRTPIVSSPMDTVTEADMAIAMASVGGAGFLHYNMTEEEQLANLKAVKNHRLGYVVRPEVVTPNTPLSFLDQLKTRRGFTSVVVTETGLIGGALLGLCTSRDHELVSNRAATVASVMTPVKDLLVGKATDAIEDLENALVASKRGKLCVVNAAGELVGLMTRSSVKDKKLRPPPGAPTVDKQGRLFCGAAVGTRDAACARRAIPESQAQEATRAVGARSAREPHRALLPARQHRSSDLRRGGVMSSMMSSCDAEEEGA